MKYPLLLFIYLSITFAAKSYGGCIQQSIPVTGSSYNLNYHRLQLTIDPAVKFIQGCITSHFTIQPGADLLTFDLADNLQVDSIIFHGLPQSFSHENDLLSIPIPIVSAAQQDSIKVYYQGVPTGGLFFTFQKYWDNNIFVTDTSRPLAFSDSEPYDSHRWWPCKQSLTDKIDSIDFYITTALANKAAANGVLQSEISHATSITYHWKHRYPIATYLIACAVSDYVVNTQTVNMHSGRNIPLSNYLFPGIAQQARDSIDAFIPIFQLLDSLLGPYPFEKEKYGHAQAPTGMENQTISFVSDFNKGFLCHELTHQWFGDKVTCGSWHELWLNEAFATYLPMLAVEAGIDQRTTALTLRTELIRLIVPYNEGMTVHVYDTSSYGSIFGMGPYMKGAMLLHMIRMKVGTEAFLQSLRNYLNDPNLVYNFSTNDKLQQHLEAVSGQSLNNFFSEWYYGEGYPVYHAAWNQVADHSLYLYLPQVQQTNVPFFHEVPLQVTFYNADQSLTFDTTLYTTENHEYFIINPGFVVDNIAFDRNKNIIGQYFITLDPTLKLVTTAITSTAPNPTTNAPIPVTITFSEAMTDFDASNLLVSGATVQHFQGNGMTYTFDLMPTVTGDIHVTLPGNSATSINGNKNSNVYFTINYTGEVTSNDSPNENAGIAIYPVPASSSVTVTAYHHTIERLVLVDMMGQQVYTQIGSDETLHMDVSSLKPGAYVLQVLNENHELHKQLILKK